MAWVKDVLEGALQTPVERVEFKDGDIAYHLPSGEVKSVAELLASLPMGEGRDELCDRVAMASVIDNPVPDTFGYLEAHRFTGAPHFLETVEARIPYGRVVAYAAWFLGVVYDKPASAFTRLPSFSPPFERLDMDEVLANRMEVGDGENGDMTANWIDTLGKLMQSNKVKAMNKNMVTNASDSFAEHSAEYRELVVENVDTFVKSLGNGRFLETELRPEKVLSLLFYLKDLIGLRADTGIIQSMYSMSVVVGMMHDLDLTKDLAKGLECPVECVRKIALCLDALKIRRRGPYAFKGSELRRREIYNYYTLIKGRHWSDLCLALATDRQPYEPSRLNDIYKLFLKESATDDTRPFYAVYLASVLERGRMMVAKSKTPASSAKQRSKELDCFASLLDKFTQYVSLVTGQTAVDTPISQAQLLEFMRIHELEMLAALGIIANKQLLALCSD